ncbi:YbdD/YjiX family protein [Nocardia vinacea]|uniref:YbdD/YjiX family protein n=1 Tax=Nocardia vinacea TaxID=96468 RepID=UPI00343A4E66
MTAEAARHRLASAFWTAVWWFDSVLGGQDYQRYVAHLRRNHPHCEIPAEREYWRSRHAAADRNPANRCC